ncbi:lipopolysaccharide biosynthesis protein, partial [Bacteroides thetaiotaomicron]
PYLISLRLQSSFYSFLILSFSCIICSFMAIFFVGCKASERVFVVDQVRKLIKNNL